MKKTNTYLKTQITKFIELTIVFVALLLILSCDCKEITYFEPTKMVELTTEQVGDLTKNSFKVYKYKASMEFKDKANDSYVFKEDGFLYKNNKRFGSWNKNRWIFLDEMNKKFYVSSINKYYMRLIISYRKCDNDEIYEETILFKSSVYEGDELTEFEESF